MSYGIGRVPRDVDLVTESLAELEAARISAESQKSWDEVCWENSYCVECTIEDNVHTPIERRVYFSNTMGCRVECEKHWLKHNEKLGATFEEVMATLKHMAGIEHKRIKHCRVCGTAKASWNSGAGLDLCPSHWDEY